MTTRSHHQLLMASGYPDFSPTDKGANITVSGAHQQLATMGAAGWNSVRGASARVTGKYYFEMEYTHGGGGVSLLSASDSGTILSDFIGASSFGSAFTVYSNNTFGNYGVVAYGGSTFTNIPAVGNKVMFALDFSNGKGWCKLSTDSGWAGTGADPVAGTNPLFTWPGGSLVLFPAASINGSTDSTTLNTGQAAFTNTPPSGYTAWGKQLFSIIDPLFSKVTNLLHFEGSNGGTIFTDQLGVTWTATGATTSTTQKKFGVTSGSFSGTVDSTQQYLTSGSNIALGAGDFCIEGWLYLTSFPTTTVSFIFDTRPVGTTGAYLLAGINSSGGITVNSNAVNIVTQTTGTLLSLNTWIHFAVTRNSGSFYCYLNGVAITAAADSTSYTSNRMIIGGSGFALSGSGSRPWNGFIDDFRISVGTSGSYRYDQKSGVGVNFVPYNNIFQNQ